MPESAPAKVIQLSQKARKLLIAAIGMGCVVTLLFPVPMLISWLILQNVIDPASTSPVLSAVLPLVFWAVAAVVLRWGLQIGSLVLSHIAAFHFSRDLHIRMLTHMGDLPLHWHSNHTMGGLKKVFTSDVGNVEGFIAHHIPDTISCLLLPVVSLVLFSFINWQMSLALLVPLAACVWVQVGSFKRLAKDNTMASYHKSLEQLNACAVEFVRGMPVIKIFNHSMSSFSKMQQAIDGFKAMQILGHKFYAPRWATFLSLTATPFVILAVLGSILYMTGSLTLPDLALFLMLSGVTLAPLTKLVRIGALLTDLTQSVNRIRSVLSAPVEKRGTRKHTEVASADVIVRDLSVKYGERVVLGGVSFTVPQGKTTAIVGASGAGKSTLASVLAGMEQIAGGDVLIGGLSIREFSQYELASLVSPVFQSPFIFTGTVAENILLGRLEAEHEEIIGAAKKTRCHEFIEELPEGYDTVIGAGGSVHLSGGQMQRVALARIVLRDTPVVVLDEATAYADAENELAIQRDMSQFMQSRTLVVVAHKLASIAGADQIIVLDQGKIVEKGTHDDLIEQNGYYTRMWKMQSTARDWVIHAPVRKEDGRRFDHA